MSRISRESRARLAASLLLLGCLTGPLAGCGSGDNTVASLLGPGLAFGTNGGGTTGAVVPALVGSWFRLDYVPDSTGTVRTLETTYTFNSDATVTRTVATRVLSNGFTEQNTSSGSWGATATTVTINITRVGGTGGVPVDSTQVGGGFGSAMSPNPPFTPPPSQSGTLPGGAVPPAVADSLGTLTGTTTYTYRIESTSQGSTLFLNELPFVRLIGTQ